MGFEHLCMGFARDLAGRIYEHAAAAADYSAHLLDSAMRRFLRQHPLGNR